MYLNMFGLIENKIYSQYSEYSGALSMIANSDPFVTHALNQVFSSSLLNFKTQLGETTNHFSMAE